MTSNCGPVADASRMDSEAVVYGCIRLPASPDRLAQQRRCMHNRRALRQLPLADSGALLSRELFAVSGDDEHGETRSQLIHFGLADTGVEYEWSHWIRQFEALLQQMYWATAVVHLDTETAGRHSFAWQALDECHRPGDAPLTVRCEWAREGTVG